MDISDKYLHLGKNDIRELSKALGQKQISGTSDIISNYEKALSRYFGLSYCVAQSSGSAALHSALYNLGVREGDEVLIPAIAPLPSALPILTARAKLVIVDSEPDGFGFDTKDLEKKITKKTKAAMLVPLWGYPIDYTETLKILGKKKIPLIEDCAQAHGSKWKGKHLGNFGKIACWSTHDRKILATGEGGFVGTSDKSLSEQVRQFSQLGFMDNEHYGVNYKLSSLQAAVGISRIADIEKQVKIRLKNVAAITKGLAGTNIAPLKVISDSRPNYYALLIKLPYGAAKNREFIVKLAGEGIPSDILKYKYKPLYKRDIFNKFFKGICRNSEETIDSITSLPVHMGITKGQLDYMVDRVVKLSKKF